MNLGIMIHLLSINIADNGIGVKEVLRKQTLEGEEQNMHKPATCSKAF